MISHIKSSRKSSLPLSVLEFACLEEKRSHLFCATHLTWSQICALFLLICCKMWWHTFPFVLTPLLISFCFNLMLNSFGWPWSYSLIIAHTKDFLLSSTFYLEFILSKVNLACEPKLCCFFKTDYMSCLRIKVMTTFPTIFWVIFPKSQFAAYSRPCRLSFKYNWLLFGISMKERVREWGPQTPLNDSA